MAHFNDRNRGRGIVQTFVEGIIAAFAALIIAPLAPLIQKIEGHMGAWLVHLDWPLILIIILSFLLIVNGCITIFWLLSTRREKFLRGMLAFVALVVIVIMTIHFAPLMAEYVQLDWMLIGRITLCLLLIWSVCIVVGWLIITRREKVLVRIITFIAMVLIFFVIVRYALSLLEHNGA